MNRLKIEFGRPLYNRFGIDWYNQLFFIGLQFNLYCYCFIIGVTKHD